MIFIFHTHVNWISFLSHFIERAYWVRKRLLRKRPGESNARKEFPENKKRGFAGESGDIAATLR